MLFSSNMRWLVLCLSHVKRDWAIRSRAHKQDRPRRILRQSTFKKLRSSDGTVIGTVIGTVASTVGMALLVCYLVMAVLFQSFLLPFVIMFSVPLAAVGGFAALFALFIISLTSPTMPMQSLDVLTMLGFVILIGVVVNNAILIVHQAINFQRGTADETPSDASFRGLIGAPVVMHGGALPLRAAIAESVRTRVRPILMSAITSVAGMIPLVFAPGAGSELYRGLGAVMGGGLLVSTIFTIVLVPLVMAVLVPDRQRV